MSRPLSCLICLVATALVADDATFRPVDLQPFANQKRSESLGSGVDGNHLSNVPGGDQTFGGVRFQVGESLVHLGSSILDRHPEKVIGIKAEGNCKKLHFLHATCFGGGPNEPGNPLHVKDGTTIGQYMVKYADGGGEGIPIVYGEDVRDWFYIPGEAETSRARMVWNGDNDRASELGAKISLCTDRTHGARPCGCHPAVLAAHGRAGQPQPRTPSRRRS
jgi:hypothetical protein